MRRRASCRADPGARARVTKTESSRAAKTKGTGQSKNRDRGVNGRRPRRRFIITRGVRADGGRARSRTRREIRQIPGGPAQEPPPRPARRVPQRAARVERVRAPLQNQTDDPAAVAFADAAQAGRVREARLAPDERARVEVVAAALVDAVAERNTVIRMGVPGVAVPDAFDRALAAPRRERRERAAPGRPSRAAG